MDALTFSLLLLVCSALAGLVGSLTGLGGGGVLIPIMVLGFAVDMRFAVGASLVAVIATSSGSAAAFVREGYTNLRIAMLLEVATVAGAISGALIATLFAPDALAAIFGVILLWTAWSSRGAPPASAGDTRPDPLATRLRLNGSYPRLGQLVPYSAHRAPAAMAVMFAAGVLSALIGIGGGVVKVFAMDRLMRLPFRVSTTTSNFMIGVTAAASAGVYLHRGQIDPVLAMPVALGALAGSFLGARLLARARTKWLRLLFALIVAAAGVQMIARSISRFVNPPPPAAAPAPPTSPDHAP